MLVSQKISSIKEVEKKPFCFNVYRVVMGGSLLLLISYTHEFDECLVLQDVEYIYIFICLQWNICVFAAFLCCPARVLFDTPVRHELVYVIYSKHEKREEKIVIESCCFCMLSYFYTYLSYP